MSNIAVARTIDLAKFDQGDLAAKKEVAAEFDLAGRENGFMILKGHGVDLALLDRCFAEARRFFALPMDAKKALGPETPINFNGYFGKGSESVGKLFGGNNGVQLREKFMISRPVPSAEYKPEKPDVGWEYQPNRWPDLPGFKDTYLQLYAQMERASKIVVRVASMALGQDEAWFDDKFDKHESTMSWMHYPPQPEAPTGEDMRSPPHSDVGAMTYLFQDSGLDGAHPGGLQILGDDGVWRDMRGVEGQIMMNIGDTMRRWTNDRWRSSKHRVANPPREQAHTARISLGFFQKPNFWAKLDPVPGTASTENPSRYDDMYAGEYMRFRMLHSVGQRQFEGKVQDKTMSIGQYEKAGAM